MRSRHGGSAQDLMMAPLGARHAGTVNVLTRLWGARLVDRAIVAVQNPVRLDQYSEPQPDIALLRPRPDSYAERHPEPVDVFLLIEVSDTTTETDRRVKMPLYARAGITDAWLVDLDTRRIEVYRAPSAEGHREVRLFTRGDTLSAAAFPDIPLPVDQIVG